MASRDKKDLRPELVQAYEKGLAKYVALYPNEPQPFITCTYRSGEEQNELFKKVPKVTNAKAGQSPHNYNPSFAFDIGFIGVDKKMDWNIKLFENFANCVKSVSDVTVWGGNFKSLVDRPHFELKMWRSYLTKK